MKRILYRYIEHITHLVLFSRYGVLYGLVIPYVCFVAVSLH